MLLDSFRRYMAENSLADRNDRILVTVSGGVDSMVMLSLLLRSGYTTGVAHCNFGLRGAESDEDEELVAREAARAGIPFYNRRFDTAGEMERTGESMEMAARRLRYTWFEELAESEGYAKVAVAHHADDSIETFFINLLRGSGLRGLTGITIHSGRIIRPMMFAARKEILEYAVANGIPFREDSSNLTTKYLRNKIRLGLLPRIREINPRFTETMRGNLERLDDAQRFIDHGIRRIRDEVVERADGLDTLWVERIDEAFPRAFVVYELLAGYGFRGDAVEALCRALEHGATGRRVYGRDHVAWVDRGRIVVGPIPDDDPCEREVGRDTARCACGNAMLNFEWLDIDAVTTYDIPDEAALVDADKLQFPLTLRRWREGDAFIPLGMTGRKKVSDLLVDRKVSAPEKQRQFVLLSGGEIVWVVGRRIDDRFRLTSATENVLRIRKEIV